MAVRPFFAVVDQEIAPVADQFRGHIIGKLTAATVLVPVDVVVEVAITEIVAAEVGSPLRVAAPAMRLFRAAGDAW
jgi:hypothetical protein